MVAQLINLLIILVTVLVFLVFIYFRLTKSKTQVKEVVYEDEEKYTLEIITLYVKDTLNELVRTNLYDLGLSKEEFDRRQNKKKEIKRALKECVYGDLNAKQFVKDFISDLLHNTYNLNDENILKVINFSNPRLLSVEDKFDILLYVYKKRFGLDALTHLIVENELDVPKHIIEDGSAESFIITNAEIEDLFKREIKVGSLKYEDRLKIIVQRVYQKYKGFSVIDEIRDMKIDGISGGVSGLPPRFMKKTTNFKEYANNISQNIANYDSVWIFFKGKSIHLSFLTFGSEQELKRVCMNVYKYNNPGQLSESNGYKVNEMKDGSRVVVVRPNFSESWAFFIRKFDSADKKDIKDLYPNIGNEILTETVKWLVKGCRVTAITGAQGTGKTTFLMSVIKFIHGSYTLRIQEMAFELHARKLYPYRNILSFRETSTVSGQEGLDLQKKTDGTVNILGEIATDAVAAWMVQMAQVASLFTIFTHHAKTTPNLVTSIRNSLLKTGVFTNEQVAEEQVVNVINFDIHIKRDYKGFRYIERITEIVPIDQKGTYPRGFMNESDPNRKMEMFMDTATEFFTRMTDRKLYDHHNIIIFDGNQYKPSMIFSSKAIEEIKEHLSDEEILEFDMFLDKHWGGEKLAV